MLGASTASSAMEKNTGRLFISKRSFGIPRGDVKKSVCVFSLRRRENFFYVPDGTGGRSRHTHTLAKQQQQQQPDSI